MRLSTPAGFRDVLAEEAIERERITANVQRLFAQNGYLPIETPTLEVMDVMESGGRIPGSPFKFFDSQGDLLAMRPDVTIQIARMYATRYADDPTPQRFRYTQRVFRETETQRQALAREMTQFGVECIGESGPETDAEIVELFARALSIAGVEDCSIAVATVGVLRALLDRSGAPSRWKQAVMEAYHESNFVRLDKLTTLSEDSGVPSQGVAPAYADTIRALPRIRGGKEAIQQVRELVEPLGCLDGLEDFQLTYDRLMGAGLDARILVDFSVISSFDYYTGLVFEAYASGLGTPLGSGGRYDHMIGGFGAETPAAGFAFYLEQAMSARSLYQQVSVRGIGSSSEEALPHEDSDQRPLRIAVPKGALHHQAVELLNKAGLDTTDLDEPGRQMVIRNGNVEYIIVRPSDAPIFVALGSADCGICGKDSLTEVAPEVVELVDLKFGGCRFVVAEPEGAAEKVAQRYRTLGSIRVATKYPNVTRAHFAKSGTQVDVVQLHGNIELAPLTGMADRIVDITATGNTLRENHLVIVEEVMASTARFFANPCAFRTDDRIITLARQLRVLSEGATFDPIAGAAM